jgi:hypothetical protein
MATVAQVAKASLQRILVQASEAPLEPDEYQDYIFALNNYMTRRLPATLPLGSGNEDESYGLNGHFYPDAEQEILAETTGAIGLEVSTNGG